MVAIDGKIVATNNPFMVLTQEAYDRLTIEERKNGTIYYVLDGEFDPDLASHFALAYNPIIGYRVDDYCVYKGRLFRCVQNTVLGDFNYDYWVEVKIGDEIKLAKQTATEAQVINTLKTVTFEELSGYGDGTVIGALKYLCDEVSTLKSSS